MIRRPIIISLLALSGICSQQAIPVSAQQSVGEWKIYPVYNSDIARIVDAGDKVYYLASNRLYSFDTKTNESYIYSSQNKLNGTEIRNIYRNGDGGYLLLVYTDNNMDMLYDNGRVVNLSDIQDASMTQSKTINDVAFYKGRIYVATDFGMVVFDDSKHQVVETGIYNAKLSYITVVNDHIIAFNNDNELHIIAPIEGRHNSLDKFKSFNAAYSYGLYPLGDAFFTYGNASRGIRLVQMDWETLTPVKFTDQPQFYTSQPVQYLADGSCYAVTPTEIVFFDTHGAVTSRRTLPEQLKGQLISFNKDLNSLWGADVNGVANYSLKEDGSLTLLADKFTPAGTSTVKEVAFMSAAADGSRIYISNLGTTGYKTIGSTYGPDVMQTTDYIENGEIHDATVPEVELDKAESRRYQVAAGNKKMYGGPQRIAVDPENPRRVYMANYLEGVFVVEDNKIVGKFDKRNMPTYCYWSPEEAGGAIAEDVIFDPEGNLWVGCWLLNCDGNKYSPYTVLPKAKLRGDLSAIKTTDWVLSKHLGIDMGEKDMGSLFTPDGMMFNWDRRSNEASFLHITNTKKTYTNPADDDYDEPISFTDQDGKTFNPGMWTCGICDGRGRVWMGTDMGIVEIANPLKVLDADFRITRLKVPRNDGTIFADYLLESEQVNDIALDASDRKWIATENSGVYLVSQAGDKIIEHFTAENSELPSNSVYSVMCDPRSNIVYFGLASGLVSYSSTSSPASADYSEVYAYPNPVRPDYTGYITITGLMSDSLVKIADASGNVFFQTRSDGGMVVWDGCNRDGERVRSGVYYVYASQNADGTNQGVVTKILVVN